MVVRASVTSLTFPNPNSIPNPNLVMARYGRGGKWWIRYDTAQNIVIRYDMIRYTSQNAMPYVTVNSPRLMQRSHWRLCMHWHAFKRHQRSTASKRCNAVHNLRQHSNVGMVRYQKLIDFSSIQTHAVNRDRRQSYTVEHLRRRSNRANVGTVS